MALQFAVVLEHFGCCRTSCGPGMLQHGQLVSIELVLAVSRMQQHVQLRCSGPANDDKQ